VIEREGALIVRKRRIRARIVPVTPLQSVSLVPNLCGKCVRRDRCVRQSSDELLNISNSLHAGNRRTETRSIPEVEIEGMIEAFPFLHSEEPAELGVSERHSLSCLIVSLIPLFHSRSKKKTDLVSTHLLHAIHILDAEVETIELL
jgi:hypothetical protein